MLSDKEKIKQLEKMLRQSQKKLELSEKKRRQAEEQLVRADFTMKRVEDRIDSGNLTLAAVLSLLNKAIDKLLPTDFVDLPHERLRVLKELLLEVQFDVSGADQISGLLRYLKNNGTETAAGKRTVYSSESRGIVESRRRLHPFCRHTRKGISRYL